MMLWQVGPLRWLIALFCVLLGALMFVTPHQFDGPSYVALRQLLPIWGLLFLLAGASLIGTVVFATPAILRVLAHILAAAVLIILAFGVISVGALLGAVGYAFLALGILAAAVVSREPTPVKAGERDLLSLVIGTSCLVSGIIVFAFPSQLSSPLFDPVRALLPLYGVGYVVGGAAVAANQLRPIGRIPLVRGAHLILGASMWAFAAPFVPLRVWSGIAYAGLFGAAIAIFPWIDRYLRRLDQSSLRTRLAVTLSAVVALALIAMVALSTSQEEHIALERALDEQQAEAASATADIADLIDKQHDMLVTLAARTDLSTMTPSAHRALLQTYARNYTEVSVFATFDSSGSALARSDDRPFISFAGVRAFEDARSTRSFSLEIIPSPLLGQTILVLAAPYDDGRGNLAGVVVSIVETQRLASVVGRAGSGAGGHAYLVDATGRLLANSPPPSDGQLADVSGRPPVQSLLAATDRTAGALVYGRPGAEAVAGYGRVPAIGWGVVVERPLAAVLATTRAGQDTSLLVLLVIGGLAALAGAWAAGRLVAPLDKLGRAVTAFADDGAPVPVPANGVTEVARLANAFADLQTRLAVRTAERERLYEAERQARADADAAVAQRDDFLSVAAHELRTPLTGLQIIVQLEQRRLGLSDVPVGGAMSALRRVEDQAHRLGRLVGQLLDISRIQAGRLTLDRSPTNLAAIVDDAVTAAQARSKPELVLLRELDGIHANVDSLRLEQVLTNLLDNALKYGADGGPIEVTLCRDGNEAIVSVRDHGPGIPIGERDQIFERFFRGHVYNHASGMGLGLAISREIISLHGGTITCCFPADGGSCFVVRLPTD